MLLLTPFRNWKELINISDYTNVISLFYQTQQVNDIKLELLQLTFEKFYSTHVGLFCDT